MTDSTFKSVIVSGRQFAIGGSRWSPKGVCYQPSDGVDPLTDNNYDTIESLVHESGNWTKLGINAIRVYQVDPNGKHDRVMSLLQSKNIYVMVGCVNSATALAPGQGYPCAVLERVKSVVDTFLGYPNVLSFSVSNELLSGPNQESSAAAAKALVRDTKKYIRGKKNSRAIPVGLVLRDDPLPNRANTLAAAHYYACGEQSDRADYIGYNEYRWCDYGPNPQGSIDAWYELYSAFKDFPIPVYFGEFGCNANARTWTQVPYLFGKTRLTPSHGDAVTMSDVVSGGFAFRYEEHGNNFGLVDAKGEPTTSGGFKSLAKQYGTITDFAASNILGSNPLACQKYNPTMPTTCGTHPDGPTISVWVTNEIVPPTTVAWSYTNDADPSGDPTWHTITQMDAGAPPCEIEVPKSAKWLSVAYRSAGNAWYGACRISMDSVSAGNTVEGKWEDGGNGACPIA